jgi:hypothetical protein
MLEFHLQCRDDLERQRENIMAYVREKGMVIKVINQKKKNHKYNEVVEGVKKLISS